MAYKDYNAPPDDDEKISKINAAGLINAKLEKLWGESDSAMASGNYLLWNTKLDSIWIILGGDEEEGNKMDQALIEIDSRIYDKGSLKSVLGKGFDKKENPHLGVLYLLLKKKALFLRRLQNSQGKGSSYKDPYDDDFD